MTLKTFILISQSVFIFACGEAQDINTEQQNSTELQSSPSIASNINIASNDRLNAYLLNENEIISDLHRHVGILASDEFEGRAPATPGEEKTTSYLVEQFTALGLQPGNGDSFFQEVPVTEITTNSEVQLLLKGTNFDVALDYGEQMMVGSSQQVSKISIHESPLVFVGYGINAPERNWNDYARIDVTGKTVVILVNDPGYATQDDALFNGNAMTYYGRWTYKYEEAERQGAAAALIVHETGAAGYPWEVVSGSWSGPQISLYSESRNRHKMNIEGWLTQESARALFAAADMDFDSITAVAAQSGFQAMPMADIVATVDISNSVRDSRSKNVIAIIPGTERPDETIIYTAHWDHLGRNPELEGDQIYNGALDNATGTAGMLALARQYMQYPVKPKRSIVFLAVTAEESGLLGSQWYVENPIYALEKTVANINMDGLNVVGPMHDMVVVGFGSSELEEYLKRATEARGRYIAQEPTPEKGFYYRSDHFNFAKHGVPALYAESGEDSIANGREWGAAQAVDYTENRYHKPSDEYDPDWDFSGAVSDLSIYFEVGHTLSQESSFPNWYPGNEFRALRDQSRAGE